MAFSLIDWTVDEVKLVVAVMGTILLVSVMQLRVSQVKTRDASRQSDLQLIARALDDYYADHEIYPEASESGEIIACGGRGLDVCEWGQSTIIDSDGVKYLTNVPQDPLAYRGYKYVYEPDLPRKHFKLYSTLEYKQNPLIKEVLTVDCGINIQCKWYVRR